MTPWLIVIPFISLYVCVCEPSSYASRKVCKENELHINKQHSDINIPPHAPALSQTTIPLPAMDFPPPLNPNHIFFNSSFDPSSLEFEPSDYLLLDDASDEVAAPVAVAVTAGSSIGATPLMNTTTNMECKDGVKKKKTDLGFRVAFKTKSDLEIMDDGFKWRKYGKKSVKNSPNPRNYYKCASGGCIVKKRVERDREDSSYVITTYEGVHNHESPCVVYYNQVPLMVSSNAWTLQASSQSSSS